MGEGVSKPSKIWRWEVLAGLCLINGYRRGAELGVNEGHFTSFLCSRVPDLHMIAVDLWAPQARRDEEGAETYADWDLDAKHDAFQTHAEAQFPGRVTILRMATTEAARRIEDGSLDFVFIDADHSYSGVKADYEAWAPKVRARGVIAGHDYNWPSVRRFVDELQHPGLAVAGDNVWFHLT